MTDRVQVDCPCCGTKLVVDASTGDVLSETRPKKPTSSFDEAWNQVQTGSQKREEAFSKAFDQTKRLDSILEKKFEEARKKAKDDPSKPRSPFDAD
jgi:hypothetical protein